MHDLIAKDGTVGVHYFIPADSALVISLSTSKRAGVSLWVCGTPEQLLAVATKIMEKAEFAQRLSADPAQTAVEL